MIGAGLSLVPPMIDTGDPDIDLVHRKVAEAVDRAEGDAPATPPAKPRKRSATSGAVTGGSLGSLKEGYAANQAEDVAASC